MADGLPTDDHYDSEVEEESFSVFSPPFGVQAHGPHGGELVNVQAHGPHDGELVNMQAHGPHGGELVNMQAHGPHGGELVNMQAHGPHGGELVNNGNHDSLERPPLIAPLHHFQVNMELDVPAIELEDNAAMPQQETIEGRDTFSALIVQPLPLLPGQVANVPPNITQQESQEGREGPCEMLVGTLLTLPQELLQRWLNHDNIRMAHVGRQRNHRYVQDPQQLPRPRHRYPNSAIVRQLQPRPNQADLDGSRVLRLPNVRMLREKARQGIGCLTSNPFYLRGHRMCVLVYLNGDGVGRGTHLSVFFVLMHGEYHTLQSPFRHQVTVTLQDQSGHGRNIERPLPTPPQPPIAMNEAFGASQFAPLSVLTDNDYVSDDTLYLLVRLHR